MAAARHSGQSRNDLVLQASQLRPGLTIDPGQLGELIGGEPRTDGCRHLFGIHREVRFVGIEVTGAQMAELAQRGCSR